MNMMKFGLLLAMAGATVTIRAAEKSAGELLKENGIAAQVSNGYADAKRYSFTFEGFKAYFDEPANPKPGRKWMWCMKWPNAFADLTGQSDGVKRGYYYVYLDDIKWMSPAGTELAKRFHDFLVDKLGFDRQVFLIGMSWGGFYSTRYAATYPDDVAKVYLDCPVMNFAQFRIDNWPQAKAQWGEPENGHWEKDSRMPINLAGKLAKAEIPLLLLYGGADTVVPPAGNCEKFIYAYKAYGGKNLQVFKRNMFAHHPHGFCGASKEHNVVDFFEGKPIKGE